MYPDSSDSSSYVDPGYSSSGSSYDNNYNYDSSYDYNNNSYDNNYSSSQTYYYSEPSYVGGGQSYVAPSNTAPSASLIKSDDNIDEKTLSSNDWSDIAKNLKNTDTSGSDGDDFNFIKNNNSKGDNGHWMFYVSLVLLSLGVAGIAYFVISTVLNRKKRVTVAAEVTLQRANLHSHSVTAVTMIMPMITHLQAESPKDAVSTILPKFSFQRTTKRAEEDTSN